jgi:hypothetical protein
LYDDVVTLVPPVPTCIAERVVFIITHLCGVIGEHGRTDRASVPFLNLTCRRLRRLCSRLRRLIAAFREGRLVPPRVRTRGEPPTRLTESPAEPPESGAEPGLTQPASPARKEQLRLPSKCGWLLRFGWQAAGSRCQFEHWLEDPEVKALVAASPQARRILRALCHMLGIELPEALRLPPRPRRKRLRVRKPLADGTATGPAGSSTPFGALSRRPPTGKPTGAEILSWMPGQKRPMPWSSSPARNKPPLLIGPKPKLA